MNLKTDLSLPLIAAPMFLISDPRLVLACCAEGIVGSFPSLNQRTSQGFEDWLKEISAGLEQLKKDNPGATIAPYAVNLIVNKNNPRLEEDLKLVVKYRVPIVITSLGAAAALVEQVHAYGGIVLHDVTNVVHAQKAIAAGVDGVIAVAAGAGGHAGTTNPMALVKDIRAVWDGILVLSGGMTDGHDIRAAQAMGADLAYMGTRFICTAEAHCDPAYKQMIVDAKASDIIYTSAISGVPANFLKQSLVNAGHDIEKLQREGGTATKLKSISDEAVAWKTIWSAGHGVANIHDVPTVKALVDRMKQEYR